jgi:hypothetical protein
MKQIYIRFAGDNDFITTVQAFVKTIAPRVFFENIDITKAKIVELFNEHAYSIYVLHQSNYEKTPREDLKEYLRIEEKDVYFDDEVKEFTDYNHDGCLAQVVYGNDIQYIIL